MIRTMLYTNGVTFLNTYLHELNQVDTFDGSPIAKSKATLVATIDHLRGYEKAIAVNNREDAIHSLSQAANLLPEVCVWTVNTEDEDKVIQYRLGLKQFSEYLTLLGRLECAKYEFELYGDQSTPETLDA